jgi:acetolactate synthase regulatory subunit
MAKKPVNFVINNSETYVHYLFPNEPIIWIQQELSNNLGYPIYFINDDLPLSPLKPSSILINMKNVIVNRYYKDNFMFNKIMELIKDTSPLLHNAKKIYALIENNNITTKIDLTTYEDSEGIKVLFEDSDTNVEIRMSEQELELLSAISISESSSDNIKITIEIVVKKIPSKDLLTKQINYISDIIYNTALKKYLYLHIRDINNNTLFYFNNFYIDLLTI